MLEGGDDYLIARLDVFAAVCFGDEVDGLCRTSHEVYLALGLCIDVCSYGLT